MPSGSKTRLDVESTDSMTFPTYMGDVVVQWWRQPATNSWQLRVHKDEPIDPRKGRFTMMKVVSDEQWQSLPELPIKTAIEDFTRAYESHQRQSGDLLPIDRDDIHWWQRMVALLAKKLCDEHAADAIMVGDEDISEAQGLYAILEETPHGIQITPKREGGPLSGEDRQGVGSDELPLLIPGLWDGDGVRPDVRDGDEDDDGADGTVQSAVEKLKKDMDKLRKDAQRTQETYKRAQQSEKWWRDHVQRSGDVKEKRWSR